MFRRRCHSRRHTRFPRGEPNRIDRKLKKPAPNRAGFIEVFPKEIALHSPSLAHPSRALHLYGTKTKVLSMQHHPILQLCHNTRCRKGVVRVLLTDRNFDFNLALKISIYIHIIHKRLIGRVIWIEIAVNIAIREPFGTHIIEVV